MSDKIVRLGKRLLPTGRAFRSPINGVAEGLMTAVANVEQEAKDDANAILYAILPDNDNFTEQDASDWERRLGLITNTTLTLEERKAAIFRKMNHPGDIPARQNYRYMERELRAAGFDVYVYENRFDDGMGGLETRSPGDIIGTTNSQFWQLDEFQLGEVQMGQDYKRKAVWSLDRTDYNFDAGSLLRRTFFIAGDPISTFADVDATRETEFRELIMKIKPVQTIAWLFVNYV